MEHSWNSLFVDSDITNFHFLGLRLSDLINLWWDLHGATCSATYATCPSMPSWNSAPIQRACAVHAAPLGPKGPDPPRTSPHSPGPTVAPRCARTRFCLRTKNQEKSMVVTRDGDFRRISLGFYWDSTGILWCLLVYKSHQLYNI